MTQNKAILEALSETECVLYYAMDGTGSPEEAAMIKAMHDSLYKMVKDWHNLTGCTLNDD